MYVIIIINYSKTCQIHYIHFKTFTIKFYSQHDQFHISPNCHCKQQLRNIAQCMYTLLQGVTHFEQVFIIASFGSQIVLEVHTYYQSGRAW